MLKFAVKNESYVYPTFSVGFSGDVRLVREPVGGIAIRNKVQNGNGTRIDAMHLFEQRFQIILVELEEQLLLHVLRHVGVVQVLQRVDMHVVVVDGLGQRFQLKSTQCSRRMH